MSRNLHKTQLTLKLFPYIKSHSEVQRRPDRQLLCDAIISTTMQANQAVSEEAQCCIGRWCF
jgi:hypothetical protein